MLKKFLLPVIGLYFLSAPSHAQDERPGWLSTKRLSFALSTAYHFNPWHSYNNAVATVTERIRLDSFFFEPTGYYEKINGDLVLSGELGYKLAGGLSFLLSAQLADTDSRFEFFPDSTKLAPDKSSVTHHQNMAFDLRSVGFGLSQSIAVSKRFSLSAAVGFDRYSGQLKMSFRHTRDWRGPLPEGEGLRVSATMKENTWGWRISTGLFWKLSNRISAFTGLEYRRAEFGSLEGPATFTFLGDGGACPFTAELVEAPNYFGVGVKEEPDCYVGLPSLTFLTEPKRDARVPASVDLTSLGIRAGLKIGF